MVSATIILMKSILVPIEDHGIVEPQLEVALQLGQLFDSYIEGIAITPDYPVVLPVDIAIGVPSPITPENRLEMARACRERFEAFMTTQQIARGGRGPAGSEFRLAPGRPDGGCLPRRLWPGFRRRPWSGGPMDRTARPACPRWRPPCSRPAGRCSIAPPTAPRSFGETVVIAWNRSTETARAVLGSMPLLKKRRRIVVLELEIGALPALPARNSPASADA